MEADPWCCMSRILDANVSGFDAGYAACARSMQYIVKHLSHEDALDVINSIAERGRNGETH